MVNLDESVSHGSVLFKRREKKLERTCDVQKAPRHRVAVEYL